MSVQEAPPVRRKKKHAHPHHGGSWKVAYADFVTAMMALFMVMWLLSQTDVTMKKKIAEYFRTGFKAHLRSSSAAAASRKKAFWIWTRARC
jgi:chemotaxis protein MotB